VTASRPPRRVRAPGSRPPGRRPTQRDSAALLPVLYRLWSAYVGEPEPPALDRWLARTLSRLDGYSREQRLWLGAGLADGVRFAWLALLCDEARGRTPGAALRHVLAGVGDTGDAWRRLRAVAPESLFFWVFLRLREAGAQPPRLAEPGPGAVVDWHRIRTGLAGNPSLAARLAWSGLPATLAAPLEQRAARSGWVEGELALFLERQVTRPPLWLRLADLATLKPVLAELRRAGFAVSGEGDAIAAVGDRGIFELECWRDGRVEIQDLASQAIGRAVAPEPGHFVWDACAGGGGKTLQLAGLMRGSGAVYATDPRKAALADLRRRAKRAGLTSVRAHPWNGDALPDFGKAVARHGGFDRVLVDAPCSGSGTWRRNPDGRLWADPAALGDLAATQSRLLDLAAGGVKAGGLLVYATCSWYVVENEDVVASFLGEHAEFALVGQQLHGNPREDADTTFSAVLRRR